MVEKSLNLPLSGEEIRKAILEKLGDKLARDCYLSPNNAYDSFECKITISLKCHDLGRIAPVEAVVTVSQGEELPDDQYLTRAEQEMEIKSDSPNQTRVETGQDVPVLSKTKEGKETIKPVRYARTRAKAAK